MTTSIYNHFSEIFNDIYLKHFPIIETKTGIKDLRIPWVSKVMKKSSRKKPKLIIPYYQKLTMAEITIDFSKHLNFNPP